MSDRKKEHPNDGSALTNHGKYTTYLYGLQEDTQIYTVLKHLIEQGSITTIEAFFDYGITRLSGRIYDLRKLGVNIETTMVKKKHVPKGRKKGATYAVYTLI